MDKFDQKVNTVHRRAAALEQHLKELSTQQQSITSESFEELKTALEELYVAEEELAIARAALEEERQRYHNLFEFAPDGYLVTDQKFGFQAPSFNEVEDGFLFLLIVSFYFFSWYNLYYLIP